MKQELFDTSAIIYVENEALNKDKWDACISSAGNGLMYAYSFYLDAMAKHWDALILNDYEAVMPVTWNRKYGIYYLYQPFLCASLGLFGKNITRDLLLSFINKIPKHFKYWDIYLNAGNNFLLEKCTIYKRTNYILHLNKPYNVIQSNFRNSYKQVIKKSITNNLEVRKSINIEDILIFAKIKFETLSKPKKTDWQNFTELCKLLFEKKQAITYGVYLKDELLASGVFLFSHNRAYYVLAGNKDEGRPLGASHIVINTFIEEHAGKDLLLDFEGSNVPKIAFFFRGFGAVAEEYPGLKYNALPRIIHSLKK